MSVEQDHVKVETVSYESQRGATLYSYNPHVVS